MNTELEGVYWDQDNRADVAAGGAEIKQQLLEEGRSHMTVLLDEGNTDEGFDNNFDLLGNVGLYMAACRRHELTEPSRERTSPLREASALALQLGSSLGVNPPVRFGDPDWNFDIDQAVEQEQLARGSERDFTELCDQVKWTMSNFSNPTACPEKAPCNASWELLKWAKTNSRKATVDTYAKGSRQLAKTFKGVTLGGITPWLIEKHKRQRLNDGVKASSVNDELTLLSVIVNRCKELNLYDGPNPATMKLHLKVDKEDGKRTRFLTHEEEGRLLAVLPEPHRTVALLGMHAGLRVPSEALGLKWTDVDLDEGVLTVRGETSKSRKDRQVYLNSVLRDALARVPRHGENVFCFPNGRSVRHVSKIFRQFFLKLGLAKKGRKNHPDDVVLHTFRHTWASRLGMAGCPARTIQVLGGWANLEMVERYTHQSEDHKKQAVELTVQPTVPTLSLQKPQETPKRLGKTPVSLYG